MKINEKKRISKNQAHYKYCDVKFSNLNLVEKQSCRWIYASTLLAVNGCYQFMFARNKKRNSICLVFTYPPKNLKH